jgi:hypothetical protein
MGQRFTVAASVLIVVSLFIGLSQELMNVTRNGSALMLTPTAAMPNLGAALLAAETTGQLPAEAWPALRELLLSASDPQLALAVDPLRQLLQARQAVAAARAALDQGYAAVAAAANNPAQLADAAGHLAALADDLSARAQQLASLAG